MKIKYYEQEYLTNKIIYRMYKKYMSSYRNNKTETNTIQPIQSAQSAQSAQSTKSFCGTGYSLKTNDDRPNETFKSTHQYNTRSSTNSTNSTNSINSINFTIRNPTNSNSIIYSIITCDFPTVKRLVNSSNVNNVIDEKNNYTSLHYAVKTRCNYEIVEYLLSVGADPKITQNEGLDSIDLAIDFNYRYLINKVISNSLIELSDVQSQLVEMKKKNTELTESNNYLIKSNLEYSNRINQIQNENLRLSESIDLLENDNKEIKRKLESSEKAFENLLKKQRKS